jgi:phospholipase/carboxylesterase
MNDIVFQHPAAAPYTQLMLLFHGVGADPKGMQPLAARLAQAFPQAFIVAVAGAHPSANASTLGQGFEWFSIAGIDDANRLPRVAQALPAFRAAVQRWQRDSGVTAHGTALVGFSQGAIMALESTRDDAPSIAGRIVALSGRFASPPERAPADCTIHLVHGKQDPVIHYGHAVQAAERLIALGGDITADVIPFLGHTIDAAVADLVVQRLTTHVPKRVWDEALRAAPN